MVFGILPQKKQEQSTEAPQVLPTAFDAASLHPMANVGQQQLEYLDLETNSVQSNGLIASRSFWEDTSYGAGTMYVLGLGTGGASGLIEGLRTTSADMSPKLRTNAILNSITRRGPYLGNLLGCLTLTYNIVRYGIETARGGYYDDATSLASGAVTGALWNGTRGFRPMLITSGICTAAAAGWCIVKRVADPDEE